MKILDANGISKYIDWDRLSDLELLNPEKETVIIGYWKRYVENVKECYIKNIVVDVKNDQHLYLQHREDLPYDLVIFVTDITMDGKPIYDIKDKAKGGVFVEGNLNRELTDGTMHSLKFLSELKHQMEMSKYAKLAVLASDKHVAENVRKRGEYKRKKKKKKEEK